MLKIFRIALLLAVLLLPVSALAQVFENPLGAGSNAEVAALAIIQNIINFFLKFVAIAALAAIIYGGARLIIGSATSESEVARAKQIILWAVIGLIIVGLAAAILRAVGTVLGIGSST